MERKKELCFREQLNEIENCILGLEKLALETIMSRGRKEMCLKSFLCN